MQVHIQYKGVESSPWMEQFITRKCGKIERFVSPKSQVEVTLIKDADHCIACIEIKNLKRSFNCNSDGADLHEAFLKALENTSRELSEQQRKIKEKIESKFFTIKKGYAA